MSKTNSHFPDGLVPFDGSTLKPGQFNYHYHYISRQEIAGGLRGTRIHWGYRSLQFPFKNWWSGITSTAEQAAEEAERLSGERIPAAASRH